MSFFSCCFRVPTPAATTTSSRASSLLERATPLRHKYRYDTEKLTEEVLSVLNRLCLPCMHSRTHACRACLLLRLSAYEDIIEMSIVSECVLQLAWETMMRDNDDGYDGIHCNCCCR